MPLKIRLKSLFEKLFMYLQIFIPDLRAFIRAIITILGSAVLIGLTLKDFLPLLADYRFNNIAIQVEVIVGDNKFTPPRILTVIPLYQIENKDHDDLTVIAHHLMNGSNCEICGKLATVGWNVWNETDFSIFADSDSDSLYNALSLEFVKRIFSDVDKMDVLDMKFAAWNSPIIKAVLNYFMWRTADDYFLQPHGFDGPGSAYLLQSLEGLNDRLVIDRLYTKVLETLCQNMEYSEMKYSNDLIEGVMGNQSCQHLIEDASVPLFLDPQVGIWMTLPSPALPEMREYQFSFFDGPVPWSLGQSHKKKAFILYPDTSSAYASVVDPIYSSFIFKSISHSSGMNVTVRYNINIKARDARSSSACTNESSIVCFTKCTKLWIVEQCKCVQLSYSRGLINDSILPYCTTAMYSACNITALPSEKRSSCLDKCKNVCEYSSYSWQITRESYDVADYNNRSLNETQFNVLMAPMVSPYAEFIWTVKNTPEQFVSQIGGIVNLYLGFDGLSVIGLIIMCVEFTARCIMTRKKKSGRDEGQQLPAWNWNRPRAMEGNNTDTLDMNEMHENRFRDLELQIMELKSELRGRRDYVE